MRPIQSDAHLIKVASDAAPSHSAVRAADRVLFNAAAPMACQGRTRFFAPFLAVSLTLALVMSGSGLSAQSTTESTAENATEGAPQPASERAAAMAVPPPLATADGVLRRAELSARLFLLAVGDRDPLLALAAAKLRKGVLGAEILREPERDGAAPEGAAIAPVTWQAMLETAMELAPGDPTIQGLVDDLNTERAKGVVSGKVYSISQIRAGGKDTYRPLEYQGNAYAEVYVEGSSQTDLNVKVFDRAGRLVCSDTDISAIAYCGWRPAVTEAFSVVVLNEGRRSTSYTLITN